jgi:DNA repair protein RadC
MTHDETIRKAIRILEGRLTKNEGGFIARPSDAANFAILKLAARKAEVFALMLLDTRHNLIAFREMFYGTIDGATVYPREVVRAAMEANAAAVVIVHNHPSGNPEPSEADRSITIKLVAALALIDVRVLDHLVVGGTRTVSLAERGWL